MSFFNVGFYPLLWRCTLISFIAAWANYRLIYLKSVRSISSDILNAQGIMLFLPFPFLLFLFVFSLRLWAFSFESPPLLSVIVACCCLLLRPGSSLVSNDMPHSGVNTTGWFWHWLSYLSLWYLQSFRQNLHRAWTASFLVHLQEIYMIAVAPVRAAFTISA